MRALRRLGCLALIAALVTGCSDPYVDEARAPTAQPRVVRRPRPPNSPSPAQKRSQTDALPPRRAAGRPAPTGGSGLGPRGLARAFAERSLNWTWRDREAPYRALLALSVGPLREELGRARSAVRRDDTIARDRLGSRGRFVAVDVQGGGRRRRLVVVVREEALIDGRGSLEGPRHRVYLAEAELTGEGWGMRRWAPAP